MGWFPFHYANLKEIKLNIRNKLFPMHAAAFNYNYFHNYDMLFVNNHRQSELVYSFPICVVAVSILCFALGCHIIMKTSRNSAKCVHCSVCLMGQRMKCGRSLRFCNNMQSLVLRAFRNYPKNSLIEIWECQV